MADLVVGKEALAEVQKVLKASAVALGNMDQAMRGLEISVVGADPFIRRLEDLHQALASAIWILGEALTSTHDFVGDADITFGEVDQQLGRRATAQ